MTASNPNGRAVPGAPRRISLKDLVRAARRSPWLSAGIPVALLATTAFFLWWVSPTYEAVTSVRIDEDKSGVAVLEALEKLSAGGSKIATEMYEMRSRTLAEDVVDSLDLHVSLGAPRKTPRAAILATIAAERTAREGSYVLTRMGAGQFSMSTEDMPARTVRVGELVEVGSMRFMLAPAAAEYEKIEVNVTAFPDAVRDFQDVASVSRPDREADVVAIRYEGTDRALVQAVPNLMAERFIGSRNDVRTQQARGTAEFLDTQITSLTAEQDRAGDALRAYRERFGVVSLEAEGEAQVKRLADMQARREELESERSSLAGLMRAIEAAPRTASDSSPYRALVGFPRLLASTAAPDLLRSLNELEAERARLLGQRTLESPDVQVWTEQIRARDAELRNIATTFLAGLTAQIGNIDGTLAGFSQQLQSIPEKELQLARLRRQAEVSAEIYKLLQLKLKESQLMAALNDPSVRIVEPAILPRKPIRPNVPLSLVLALMAGVALGFGAAFARDQLDDTVHTRDELQFLAGTPVLGAIPRIDMQPAGSNGSHRRKRGVEPAFARVVDEVAGTPVTEAYRSLRTNINFSHSERRPRTLVVTSPGPGDGKSTTAANLASTMTKQGLRCLIIDADLRRGSLHGTFNSKREPGLTNVLMGDVTFADALHRAAGQPDFLATGTLPPNPTELLGSTAMEQLLRNAAETYDTIVLDAPPMNLVTDAAVLARIADGVIVVARAGVTTRDAISYTVDQLAGVRATVLGTVLNDADLRRENHYGAYMQNYYSTQA